MMSEKHSIVMYRRSPAAGLIVLDPEAVAAELELLRAAIAELGRVILHMAETGGRLGNQLDIAALRKITEMGDG